jgi:multiple sugar transport system substrate-binding protein
MIRMNRWLAMMFLLPVFFLSGCGEAKVIPYKVDLEVWGVFDDTDAYSDAFSKYQALNDAHIGNITYKKLQPETYREDLLRAFAEGKGPDIFLIRNAWLPDFESLIAPAPDYQTNVAEFGKAFPDGVVRDFVSDGKIYGAPLSEDSLALYYNKDIFNAAGIASPPKTWDEVSRLLLLFNRVDNYGTISQSGIALGTADNINRSTDIFLALALQMGLSEDTKPGLRDKLDLSSQAGQKALTFYLQFARVGSPDYSWNPRLHYSIDAFSEGSLAMMVNYSWQVDAIKRKNAKLNFGTAPLPQFSLSSPQNISNYWGFVVAKNKSLVMSEGRVPTFPIAQYNDIRTHESWEFLHFLTFPHPDNMVTIRNTLSKTSVQMPIPTDPAKAYLEKTGKPPARRDLIESGKNDPYFGAFSYGNLIARGWRQPSIEKAELVLAAAIESVNRGESTVGTALSSVMSQINLFSK